jgi:leucyl aminopeptidase
VLKSIVPARPSARPAKGTLRLRLVASDDAATVLRKDAKEAVDTGYAGDPGEIRLVGTDTLLLGVGKRDSIKAATMRSAGAKVVRTLARMKNREIAVDADRAFPKSADLAALGRAFAEGLAIANWRVTAFDGKAATRKPAAGQLRLGSADRDLHAGISEGLAIAESVNFARELAATPPNVCTPAWVAKESKRLAARSRLRCRVIGFAEAKRLGMGGLVAVGQGSDAKACLIALEHRPRKVTRSAKDVHLLLVGKTLTYDTGGYSLKVNNGMKGMKYDKCGGTAVLGAMHAIAAAGLPVKVTALLPAAENMVNGESFRPDDIITMENGVTVEVTNTDAEGRLVLADALSWGARTYRPTAIVDMATLTGGVVVALGSWCAGLMCNDADLRGRVERAADTSGDRVWHLPVWDEHRDYMRSQHADLINSNPGRLAHPLQGGAFLSFFVDPKTPWAHVDIAGTASVEGSSDLYAVPGPTGYGVRLLYELVRGYAG